MDKIVSRLAGFGVPSLVLIIAINATGYAGGAAIVTALAALGPGGILGGIATLGIIGLIVQALAEFGLDELFSTVVAELIKQGESRDSLVAKINHYSISKSLKRKLREQIMA